MVGKARRNSERAESVAVVRKWKRVGTCGLGEGGRSWYVGFGWWSTAVRNVGASGFMDTLFFEDGLFDQNAPWRVKASWWWRRLRDVRFGWKGVGRPGLGGLEVESQVG